MNRKATITLAVALVVALAAMPLGAAAGITDNDTANETESVAPGEQLTGVVGVQEAEVQGELSDRTHGIKLANAQSDDERADIVEEQFDDVEQKLAEHEQRLDELADARENGEITEGQYQAEVATVAAEAGTTERTAASANATAGELPAETLEERNINVSAIEELQTGAADLGGPAVAEIAQSIAGDSVGQSLAQDRAPGAPIETPGPDQTDDAEQGDADSGPESDDDEPDEESQSADEDTETEDRSGDQ